ncbi:meiosis 1 arrest protein [Heteronotia binoei]|uniref:meiosis 1 arrest protein n=1 Tax=Heteronotia binoei TaxID=13085 RepID=UPI0029305EE1|nr:meiosis 1 arrest protein [Heteronotia binoei]
MDFGRGGQPAAASSRQPSRILVVDVCAPCWPHTCHGVCEALENVFSLVGSLAGPPRIPLLSIYAAQSRQPECLLPFVPVREGFAQLQRCLAELRALPTEGAFQPEEGAVTQAVKDGLQQFKQFTRQSSAGASLSSSWVEITVLTSQAGTEVVKQLEAGLQGVDLIGLHQLQVVVIGRAVLPEPTDAEGTSRARGEASCFENSVLLGTAIDLQAVENDLLALETSFKAWLQGGATDQEHLHLLLPPGPLGANPVQLKCDIQERLLDPALLATTFHSSFSSRHDAPGPFGMAAGHGRAPAQLWAVSSSEASPVGLDCGQRLPPEGGQDTAAASPLGARALAPGAKERSQARPSLELQQQQQDLGKSAGLLLLAGGGVSPHRVLQAGGLCASVLFGLPLLIRPTSCWRLNWDELEANQHSFQALCHCLRKREGVLLVQSEPQEMGPGRGPLATSYQVLLPSGASSLLLQSVAVRELLLPCSFPLLPDDLPGAEVSKMESTLDRLPVDPAYNPLSVTSSLYQVLRSGLGQPRAPRIQRVAGRHLPRQQSGRQPQSKARAAVAPLRMAPPPASTGPLPLCSREEEDFTDSPP